MFYKDPEKHPCKDVFPVLFVKIALKEQLFKFFVIKGVSEK